MGASHVGIRYFERTIPVDETSAARPGTGQPLARIFAESPGSHRGDGLLHRSNPQFSMLYGFFVISHDRRQVLHFNVTKHPTSLWVVQQLREAFSV